MRIPPGKIESIEIGIEIIRRRSALCPPSVYHDNARLAADAVKLVISQFSKFFVFDEFFGEEFFETKKVVYTPR